MGGISQVDDGTIGCVMEKLRYECKAGTDTNGKALRKVTNPPAQRELQSYVSRKDGHENLGALSHFRPGVWRPPYLIADHREKIEADLAEIEQGHDYI